eukprot:gnl/Spiro4/28336_TR14019_c0_g1_i1.p1 gnl/Spiro4/28336_TR14019_c0_g1~~gnl/Spiro4/28336_TR14019_c0_g1_i1.p1  ORF type:complete len:394 (+),score=24.43 gnl/Spiro4/28336_TR14019_c0_g1_i1:485-1666(+)
MSDRKRTREASEENSEAEQDNESQTRRRTTERDRVRIELLFELGYEPPDIAAYTQFSIATIYNVLGNVTRAKEASEIKSPLFHKYRTQLECMFTTQPRASAQQLVVDFHRISGGEDISVRQMQRWRLALGFKPKSLIPKLILSRGHMDARLTYCRRLQQVRSFRNWIFSDECLVKFGGKRGHNSKVFVRDTDDGLANRFYFHDERNSYRLMVWGAISVFGGSPLVFLHESETSLVYAEFLLEHVLPWADRAFPHGRHTWCFVHDNARQHTGQAVSTMLARENVQVVDHPARSPDLNPIESVWAAMKARIGRSFCLKPARILRPRSCRLGSSIRPRSTWSASSVTCRRLLTGWCYFKAPMRSKKGGNVYTDLRTVKSSLSWFSLVLEREVRNST